MTDYVSIRDLSVAAVIGWHPWEREIEQALVFSVDMVPETADVRRAAATDDLADALDYSAVAAAIATVVREGRFRLIETAAERVAGSLAAYARFDGYVPRPDGAPSYTAGPKIVHVDRVEWHTIPDPATAAAAMLAGEMDWWEAAPDFLPKLRQSSRVRVQTIDPLGGIRVMRFNHLQPPFDNPAVRRALLPAISQAEVMSAYTEDRSLWHDRVGVFTPGTPMATDIGIEVLAGDIEKGRAALAASGYDGTPIVVLHPADQPEVSSNTMVGVDIAHRIGFAVDLQTMDWATLLSHRAKMGPAKDGGWNMVFTGLTGAQTMDPSIHIALRGNGTKAWAGWPTMPRIEALRTAWFNAPDEAAQKAICVDIQKQFWLDVPYIPLGQTIGQNALNVRVTDVPVGQPLFYGLRLT